ncbi:MAG TPA: hypothetical protein PLD20_32170 [Blastocatellia bacterium]|nr:hypothetical protein [Blastocatellia bacterium]HMV87481.1 hypothetical protein [Blastocatellia bacterium]HMX29332.1 hypothetical protein [Blastocatellia bacterium]HMY73079.1 hypothetical protein [Blastocatellia bacterium]HMZ22630.1 hypothetical protein [Blastocatellia bacterium]
MTKTVTIFLTPKPEAPTESLIATFPDPVVLFIEVEVDNNGNKVVTDIDEVIWQYSQIPPPESGLPPFPGAPAAIDLNVEVRLPPLNTPFGPAPTGGNGNNAASLLPAPDAESFENIGINPLVPNRPREDAAAEPTEPLGFVPGAVSVEGPPSEYEYAVILTSRTTVNAVDPKIIIIRRHRRRSEA